MYFQQITTNKYLEERIFTSILSKDEIADAASSELASIRRRIRQQSAKIRESLQKIITSPSYAKILQEPIVTIRSDRFVVPVKAECKSQLPGLCTMSRPPAARISLNPCPLSTAITNCATVYGRAQGDRAHSCRALR